MPLYAVVGIYWVGSPCLGLHRFSGLGFGDVRVEEWDDAIFSCRAGGRRILKLSGFWLEAPESE